MHVWNETQSKTGYLQLELYALRLPVSIRRSPTPLSASQSAGLIKLRRLHRLKHSIIYLKGYWRLPLFRFITG